MDDAAVKILVIDDEEIVNISIQRILSRFNYQVTGVLKSDEGLRHLTENPYDAMITDLKMPQMDGIELLTIMQERGIKVPSIMITGYPTIKTAIQALRLGAIDYIPKPFTRHELLSPLHRILRRAGKEGIEVQEHRVENAEGVEPPKPGDCYVLPRHSWACYEQDGTVLIGIEGDFLSSLPQIDRIETVSENDLIEQGYTAIKISGDKEIHNVFMPLSGRIVAVNTEKLSQPNQVTEKDWLIKLLPSQILEDIKLLQKRVPPTG